MPPSPGPQAGPATRRAVLVTGLSLRDFRSYASVDVPVGATLTVVTGGNGAGKSNLLEALYFGCTGRSFRTSGAVELVRFGAPVCRVEVRARDVTGEHCLAVGLQPGVSRRVTLDGAPVDRIATLAERPLVAVFAPDRLELVSGRPALRRAHVDQLVAGLWPARAMTRVAYARALAQRNALLGRVRTGMAGRASLAAWDAELARHAIALRDTRAAAVATVATRTTELGREIGLEGGLELRYQPRSRAADAAALAAELSERIDGDLERGFTGHGPHRDELGLRLAGRELRVYGSQGQRRLALLALLLAERAAIAETRDRPPLMLLDDVMSELDADRRARLVALLRVTGGQSVIATTDLAHVPGGDGPNVLRLAADAGAVLAEMAAA